MNKLSLKQEWIQRLQEFDKLYVGYSGGLDSTTLLHLLVSTPQLQAKLVAVHVNHGISDYAAQWQQHAKTCCRNWGIEFIEREVSFNREANKEQNARDARYGVYASLMSTQDCLILGHHRDDLAETLLLQLCRGAGIDGLAAMHDFNPFGLGWVARPLLSYSRDQLHAYALTHKMTWVEDESNADLSYSRNYVRHHIMPMLKKKWPGAASNIARTAIHCQQAKLNMNTLAEMDCPDLLIPTQCLSIEPLINLKYERIINVLRVWLKKNNIKAPSAKTLHRLITEVIFARIDALPLVSWNQFNENGTKIEIHLHRFKNQLYLDKKEGSKAPVAQEWTNFPSPFSCPNSQFQLLAVQAEQGLRVSEVERLFVRFRQGGETIKYKSQTKQLKNLFQEWGVPPWLRDRVPLVYINDELAVVVGYATSDLFFTSEGGIKILNIQAS